MKVLVTGARDWRNYEALEKALASLRPDVIVHGNAFGADNMSGEFARGMGIRVRSYPANWNEHGKSAGPIRNEEMFRAEHRDDEPIDVVVACPLPWSKGTKHAMGIARRLGIRVVEVSR